jgi:hypothetical protein
MSAAVRPYITRSLTARVPSKQDLAKTFNDDFDKARVCARQASQLVRNPNVMPVSR